MKTEGVIQVVATWRTGPEAVDEVRQILHELASQTLQEEGCVSFTVLEAVETPGHFVLLEEYAGEPGRSQHLRSAHFRHLVLDLAVPLLTHREVGVFEEMRSSGRNIP